MKILRTVPSLINLSALCFAFVPPLRTCRPRVRQVVNLRKGSDNEMDSLQQLLYEREVQSMRKGWLKDVSTLPFECTSCGKCCQTIGDVFMSPEELTDAADYMNVTVSQFIDEYADQTIYDASPEDKDLPWILIKDKNTETGPACTFLDMDTNFCQIYPVRPAQCSTYPFWTNIMESEANWNDEVRRQDGDDSSAVPEWTPDAGGCEGMKRINPELTAPDQEGVPIVEAMEQLVVHQRVERRVPRKLE